jgi:hypothetical protein
VPVPSRHLFDRYPSLAGRVPFVELGSFPTPVDPLDVMAEELGLARLLIKRGFMKDAQELLDIEGCRR